MIEIHPEADSTTNPTPETTEEPTPDPTPETIPEVLDNAAQQRHSLSFQVDSSFDEPVIVHERSIDEQPPSSIPTAERPLTFEVIPKGSQLGKHLLTDSHGYTYVIKEIRNVTTVWCCSVRSRTLTCPARVSQKNSTFKPGSAEHNHPPNPSRRKARSRATDEPFTSSTTIVSDAVKGIETSTNIGNIRQDYLARCVNRFRQHLRPAEPKDIHFELQDSAIPTDFIRKDIHMENCRHIVFATDNQLSLLNASKRWYVDGTFKCTRDPFTMLLSVHAFVRRADVTKQVPLVYVLMSGRRSEDYEVVLEAIKTLADSTPEEVVSDYEAALWKAIRKTMPQTSMKGCAFHWGQAVWRHVQSLGLATEYVQDKGTCSLIRMIFCLPFLPAEHIAETFQTMEQFAATERLQPLFEYLRNTWITSTTWPVTTWSVFGQSIRTNNDVEGWHRRLNSKAGKAPAFYNLVQLLNRESGAVDDNVQMVTELVNQRIQRKTYRNMQSKIFQAWDRYREKTLTTSGLLKTLSTIYRPRILRTTDNEDATD